MNASRVWKASVLSLVVLGWVVAGCGSTSSPVAPMARVGDGAQPPTPQDEVGPPVEPPTPQLPPSDGGAHENDRDRIGG